MMRFMVWMGAWMGMVGCAGHWDPQSHLGRDGTQEGAREIELECDGDGTCSGERRDVLTWRGGDTIDWFRVRIPRTGCSTNLRVALTWEPAREGTRLSLTLGGKQPYTRARSRGARSAEAYVQTRTGGELLIRVSLPKPDGAAEYRLRVTEDDHLPCVPGDIYSPRPDRATPPVSAAGPAVAVQSVGMTRRASPDDPRWWTQPSLVLDASDPRVVPGRRAVLVDARGVPVKHGAVEIVEVWSVADGVRFASARIVEGRRFQRRLALGWDLWHVALQ